MNSGAHPNLLEARGVKRDFDTSEGPLAVLKGVELSLNRGEMVAVVGHSGVGKSTLLHILGGLDKPTEGEVEINGRSFEKMDESGLAMFRNSHIGFVFQHHYLLDDFTALENVMIPALIAGNNKKTAQLRAEQLLEAVGLINRKNHRPQQLSGGEQQRVAVARALVNRPGIVLADEPSGNLDVETGRKLHKLLADLNKSDGTTFLIATHNRELAHICNRVVELKEGRIQRS